METEALGRMRPKSSSRRSSSFSSPWRFFGSSSKSEDNDGMSVGSMSTNRSSSSRKSKPSSKRNLFGRSSSASVSRGTSNGSDISSKQHGTKNKSQSQQAHRTDEDADTKSLLSSHHTTESATHAHDLQEPKKVVTSHTHMRSASTSRVTVVRSVSNSRPKEQDDFFPTPRKITPGKKRHPPGLAEQPSYRWGAFPARPKSTSRGRAGSSRGRATPPPEQAPSPRSSSRRERKSMDLSPLQMTGSGTQSNTTTKHTRTPSTGASTTNTNSSSVGPASSSEQRIQQAVANLPKRKLDFDTSILDSLAQIEANIERDPKARDSAAVQRRKMAAAGSTSFSTSAKGKKLLIPHQNKNGSTITGSNANHHSKPQKKKGGPTSADTMARLTKAATSLDALGNSHYERGEYAKAMDAYNKALKIKRRLVQEVGNETLLTKNGGSGEKESLLSIATSLNNIGYCRQHLSRPTVRSASKAGTTAGSTAADAKSSQRKKKEQEDAMSVYTESLNLKIQALGRDNVSVAKTRNNIGSVYFSAGDYDKAMAEYREALRVMRLSVKAVGKRTVKIALADFNERRRNEAKNPPKAKEEQKSSASEHKPENPELDTFLDMATVYNNMGDVFLVKFDADGAIENYNEALCIRWDLLDSRDARVRRMLEKIASVTQNRDFYSSNNGNKVDPDDDEDALAALLQKDYRLLKESTMEDIVWISNIRRDLALDAMRERVALVRKIRGALEMDADANSISLLSATPTLSRQNSFESLNSIDTQNSSIHSNNNLRVSVQVVGLGGSSRSLNLPGGGSSRSLKLAPASDHHSVDAGIHRKKAILDVKGRLHRIRESKRSLGGETAHLAVAAGQ